MTDTRSRSLRLIVPGLAIAGAVLLICIAVVAGCLHRRPLPSHVVPPQVTSAVS